MKRKTRLSIMGGLLTSLIFATPMMGATTGTVDLTGSAVVNNAVVVASAGTPVTTLGSSAHSDVQFGTITIGSNDGAGFDINVTSTGADPGSLVLLDSGGTVVSTPATDQKLAYTMQLVAAGSGTLGTGITVSTDLASNKTLSGTATTFVFNGPASSATTGYVLNMTFTTALKTSLLGGAYKDTVQVEIVER